MRATPPGYEDVLESASFPLVPYSNRVRDGVFSFRGQEIRLERNNAPQRHPLHGVAWRRPWTVQEVSDHHALLVFDWPGGDWPWSFRAEQVFILDEDGLSNTISIENTSGSPMPVGLGLHPYFPCPPGTVLDTEVADVFTVDDELFPNGREPAEGRYALKQRVISGAGLDNGYSDWSGVATIRWPDGRGLRITGQPPARWFQVYAPENEPVLVAEPVSHGNGALNASEEEASALGLQVLTPGAHFTLSARFDPI